MKTYRRETDNKEIHDFLDRNLAWVAAVYGEGFVEVSPTMPTAEENIVACCKTITEFANAKYAAGLEYLGNTYQIGKDAVQDIGHREQYAAHSVADPVGYPWSAPYNKGWWDVTNTWHPMTAAEFMAFAKTVSDYCSCVACCARDHKNAVTALNHATYDYSTGWPVQPGI
jgi:hypothetical protein